MRKVGRIVLSLVLVAWPLCLQAQEMHRDTTLAGCAPLGPRNVHLYAPHLSPMQVRQSYLQGSFNNETDLWGDVAISMFPNDSYWDILVFGHADGYLQKLDLNDDGYQDDPTMLNVNLGTAWVRTGDSGAKVYLGVKGMLSNRLGGQIQTDDVPSVIFSRDKVRTYISGGAWKACELERSVDAYAQVVKPFGHESVLDLSLDYSIQTLTSTYGNENKLPQLSAIYYGRYSTAKPNIICRIFDTVWQSAYAKAEYSTQINSSNSFSIAASEKIDRSVELFCKTYDKAIVDLSHASVRGSYSFSAPSGVLGVSSALGMDHIQGEGVFLVPRLDLRLNPLSEGLLDINASLSRDVRRTWALMDNLQTLASAKDLTGHFADHPLQDKWDVGLSVKSHLRLPFDCILSLRAGHTSFSRQMILDYDSNGEKAIDFVLLSDIDGGKAYVNEISGGLELPQILKGVSLGVSGFLKDAEETLPGRGLVQTPLVPVYGASAEFHFFTRRKTFHFDLKGTLVGPSKVWDCMNTKNHFEDGMTPSYVLLDARVSQRIGGWEFFVDGSNLLGFIQPDMYLNMYHPFHYGFDASLVWAPTTGRRVVVGAKVNIFKRR